MIKSTKFWYTHFAVVKSNTKPRGDEVPDVLGIDAALALIDAVFPDLNKDKTRVFLEQWTEPKDLDQRKFFIQDIEFIATEFNKSSIVPSTYDLTAIVYETLDRVFMNGAPFNSLLAGQENQFDELRLFYPTGSFALSLQPTEKDVQKAVESHIESFEARNQKRRQAVVESFKSELRNLTDECVKNVQKEGENEIERIDVEGSKMLDQKKKELVDNLILQDVMELWDSKAENHQKWFRVGAALFFGMIAVPILAGVANFGAVTAVVKSMLPAGSTLPWGSLLVFTLPALGYAWILRLVSRFTLQNLTLADDAAQRSVMAKTFIRLAAEEKVHDEKDRAIMLNALFRPIPGAKDQDLQPPTIADFVSKQS